MSSDKPEQIPAKQESEQATDTNLEKKDFNVPDVLQQLGSMFNNATEQAGNIFGKVPTAAERLFSEQAKAELTKTNQNAAGLVPLKEANLVPAAKSFLNWLRPKNKGSLELFELTELASAKDLTASAIQLKEPSFLGQNYLFVFAVSVSVDLTNSLLTLSQTSGDINYGGIVIFAEKWPLERWGWEKELSVFIQAQKIWLGKDSTAVNYIADWLSDTTRQPKWEKKELVEGKSTNGQSVISFIAPTATAEAAEYFLGREAEFLTIARSILSLEDWATVPPSKKIAWLFSVWGQGGNGKSYFLQNLAQLLGPRICCIKLDFQGKPPVETEDALSFLLAEIASKFKEAGCPTARFDNIYRNYRVAQDRQTSKIAKADNSSVAAEVAQGVKEALGGTAAKGLAKQASLATGLSILKHVPGLLNIAGTVVEAGFGVYDRISQEETAKNEALLRSKIITELTEALLQDLGKFASERRKKYFLPRRVVLIFDTYEVVGALVDKWLLSNFLKSPAIKTINPIIILAGRYELFRYNSRWTEFSFALQNIAFNELDQETSLDYLARLGVADKAKARSFYELTQGSPLFLRLIAGMSSRGQATRTLTERILEEIEPNYHSFFVDMAVPDGFNLETVQQLVTLNLTAGGKTGHKNTLESDVQVFFERLKKATFTELGHSNYQYLPGVRRILLAYLELENPARLKELRQKLA